MNRPTTRQEKQKLWLWLTSLVFCMLVFASFPSLFDPLLEYQRAAILDGQVWRLVSCHFVHLNGYHFLLDATGLLLVTYIFRDILTSKLLAYWLLLSAPLCGGLLLLDPQLLTYAGLSGILHGWLTLALVIGLPNNPKSHTLILLLLTIKLLYEQTSFYHADYLNQLIDGNVYPLAHLYGALIGLLIGLCWLYRNNKSCN